MAKEREIFIDIARAIGIFLVVCGHYVYFMQIPYEDSGNLMWSVARFVTLFHMPLFFVISGYLYKPRESFKKLLQNITKRLLTPYVLICLLALVVGSVLKCIRSEWTISMVSNEIIHNVMGILTGDDFPHTRILFSDSMWFVYSLVIVRLFYGAMTCIVSSAIWGKIILFTLAIGGLYMGNILPFRLDCSIVGLLFFSIGDICKPLISKMNILKLQHKIVLILLQVLVLGICWYFNIYIYHEAGLSISRMYFGHYPILFLVSGLSGSLLVFLISSLIRDNKITTMMSKNSIIILGFHQIVMLIIAYFAIMQEAWWMAFGICVFVCIICCMLGEIMRKYVPAFVGYR